MESNPYAASELDDVIASPEAVTDREAEAIRKAHIKHEASLRSIGSLYYLGAIGTAMLVLGTSPDSPGIRVGVIEGTGLLLVTALLVAVGTGIRRLRRWARIPSGIFAALGLFAFPVGTIINACILYLLFSPKSRMVFSEEYQRIIKQTPQVRYRTPLWMWIVLILVLLAVGLVLVAIFEG